MPAHLAVLAQDAALLQPSDHVARWCGRRRGADEPSLVDAPSGVRDTRVDPIPIVVPFIPNPIFGG